MSDLSNVSMMDLFREEVRVHTATLSEGLLALENNASNPKLIEPLMRAAHSMKGAARIVNIEPAVQLAHAMENIFIAIQEGRVAATPGGIDVLLAGTDLLGGLCEVREAEMANWCARQQGEVERLKSLFQVMEEGQTSPAVTNVSTKAMLPVALASLQIPEVPSEETLPVDNDAMLAVFRQELHSSTREIREALVRWLADSGDLTIYDPLIQAGRSLRGAAKIVRLEPVVVFGDSLLASMMRAHETKKPLPVNTAVAINDALLSLIDCLGVEEERLHDWLEQKKVDWSALSERLDSDPGEDAAPVVQSSTIAAASRELLDHDRSAAEPTVETVGSTPVVEKSEAVVRVTAQSLNRLMGLAGESLVQARWLDPFSMSLLKLKKQQDLLADAVDSATQGAGEASRPEQMVSLLEDVRQETAKCRELLAARMEEFHQHAARAEDLNSRLYREVIASRMRPFSDGAHAFPRLVRDMARDLDKQVRLEIEGSTTAVDRDILEKLEAPLTHLLRNAVDHGIEYPAARERAGKPTVGSIRLSVRHRAGMLSISIADDGKGIDPERLREKIVERRMTTADIARRMNEAELLEFLFLPGFSTASQLTEYSGRGVGLDVVQTMVRQVGGSVRISSTFEKGSTFHLQLPITLSVLRAVIVNIAGEPYAFPQNRIDRLIRVLPSEIHSVEHRQFITVDDQHVGLVFAAQLLDLESTEVADAFSVILLSDSTGQFGLIVDSFQGEQDLVVRPLDARLGKVPTLSAAAIRDDGSPILIVDVEDMIRSMDQFIQGNTLRRYAESERATGPRKRVLVVDDSITVREVERQLLRAHGYDVSVAVDGRDGWNMLHAESFDLVVSDVDMPRMNGLELVQAMRNEQALQRVPVIIVSYKEREEDRLRGLEVGANAYLTKSSFHDNTFLETVTDLIGES